MNTVTEYNALKQYDEFLNEVYGEVTLGIGLTYSASRVLKEVDPIAYRCGFNDWLAMECSNGRCKHEKN